FATVRLPSGREVNLAIKVAVAIGPVRRFLVGNPSIQLIDVLAGETLSRMAIAEQVAQTGEIVVDPHTAAALEDVLGVAAWRTTADGPPYAVVAGLQHLVPPTPWPLLPEDALSTEQLRPWLLPVVFERLHAGQGEFLTELRPAVALFLRFAGIDYEHDEAAGDKLDRYIRWVQAEGLARYEGTLLQLTIGEKGSYLYATFGAPIAHEDDAHRATSAALQLVTPPPHLGVEEVRIGISRGMMRTGAYGGSTRRTYGSLGDEVNLAARLMQNAAVGQILASGRVQAATQADFIWEALPPIRVKGKEELVPLFALLGRRQEQSIHLQEPAYRLPMVGRAAELAQIKARLRLAEQGQGQIVGITAEAGMGKSRLIAEVIRAAQVCGFTGLGGECQSYATNSPYLSWQPIVRGLFDLEPTASLAAQLTKSGHHLSAIDPSLLPRLPLLGAVLNLPLPDNDLTAFLEPELRKSSMEALVVDCLRHASREAPLLLVLEDVHWIDPLSHDLLEAVGRAIGSLPILIVLAYRPPSLTRMQEPRVSLLPYYSEIRLNEFTPEEAEYLIAAQGSENAPIAPEVVQQLIVRAQGNPFYIEELLNYLQDRGVDTQDGSTLAQLELPTSLHSLILSRIDQLGERQQITLKVASVLGRLFRAVWLWGYYPALGVPAEIKADLETLSRLDLTPQEAPEPELAYLFKHVVTQEVAYESLSYATRAALHEQFGRYLEAQAARGALRELALPREAPLLDLLAYHYERSDNLPKKQVYLRLAGAAAQSAYANEAALDYYARLLPLLDESNPREQIEIRLALGTVLELVGRWEEAQTRYQEALAQVPPLQDDILEASCQRAMGRLLLQRGACQEALLCQERARAICAAQEDGDGVGQALTGIGEIQFQAGNLAEAREALEEALSYLRVADNQREMALALNHLGMVAWNQGQYPLAQSHFEESLALQEE
ncbi:MAG: AAA family ATPase, partial [Ardenticatenales bacterium]|nr:AAA family ATPase [Ardenticatenales bacterium]